MWTLAVFLVTAPLVAVLCGVLWDSPMPVREAVALFEDVARQPASRFFVPETAYYRPLFHATLDALWHHAGSLDAALAGVKLLHIVPVAGLVAVFIGHLRPRTFIDAAAAAFAVAVLVGSRGFRDNLEIPLSYTIIGMPLALLTWILVNRERRSWHGPAILALTVVAVGFKEQGLVIIPLVIAAWWLGAPGTSRGTAATLALLAVAYVAIRLMVRSSWPLFEQSIGLGFTELEPREAEMRFGAFPYMVYAYSGLSTIGNVLFSEPTRGVFRITKDLVEGHPEIWEMIHLLSSAALTMLIAWWGIAAVRTNRFSADARLFIVMVVVLVASGALSFNYSRDRLGGMAVVFYALAAYHAVKAAANSALQDAAGPRVALAAAALALLGVAWQTRAVSTLEIARIFSSRNQLEWLVMLPERRVEFRDRPVYLEIMTEMLDQGTKPDAARPTNYPRIVKRVLGLP